ncbi:MAG: type IV pilus assembly protein PilM [Candidatus Omnitrophota bacterium]
MTNKSAKPKEVRVGLDIGTKLIKALEVSHLGDTIKLNKSHFVEVSEPTSVESLTKDVKKLLEEFHPDATSVNISLSAPQALVRFITISKMKEEDLRNSLRFEAEKYIPFNINEVIIDAVILSDKGDTGKDMRVLLAAGKKNAVDTRLKLLKDSGLTAAVIDIDSFACFNAFCNSFKELDAAKSIALLNIGYSQTSVVILQGSVPFFTRDIQIGGKNIAEAISKTMGVKAIDAEKMIYEPGEKKAEIFEAAKPALASLVEELRLSVGYYENQFGKSINEIYLSGGIARMGGISGYLEENFGIKPSTWNPFLGFEIDAGLDKALLEKIAPQFVVCAGLALRK